MERPLVSSDPEHNAVMKPPTVPVDLEHIPLVSPTDFGEHEHNAVLKPPTVSVDLEHFPLEPPTDFSDHEDHTLLRDFPTTSDSFLKSTQHKMVI